MHVQRVLVAESEPSLQLTICAVLLRMGVTPHRAETVDNALVILASARVDVVVLGAQLPDSLSLLTFLRATAEYADVPVLLYADGTLSDADAEVARRNGAEVFSTPYEHRVFIDRVGAVLDAVSVRRV
jgi:DNA-binding response OmpR family regulator